MNYWLRAKVREGEGERKRKTSHSGKLHTDAKPFFPLSFLKGIGHTGAFVLCQVGLQALSLSSLPSL